MTKTRSVLCVLPLVALALAGCGQGGDGLHRGYFSNGFETVAFRECGSTEVWWVDGESEAMQSLTEQYMELAGFSYREVYVELRGDVSAPGAYGHLGAYPREFHVTETVAVGGDPPSDCN